MNTGVREVPKNEPLRQEDQRLWTDTVWPVSYRKPAWQPWKVSEDLLSRWRGYMRRADQLAADGGVCGCVIVENALPSSKASSSNDDQKDEVPSAFTDPCIVGEGKHSDFSPISFAVMNAINSAAERHCKAGQKRKPGGAEAYLCTDCVAFVTAEPNVMCAMALLHSRVSAVIFRGRDSEFGGVGGAVDIHYDPRLNHTYRAFRVTDKV